MTVDNPKDIKLMTRISGFWMYDTILQRSTRWADGHHVQFDDLFFVI